METLGVRFASILLAIAALGASARADDETDEPTYLLRHPDDSRWWMSLQVNLILQAQPGFRSPYHGPNSFLSTDHVAPSIVTTLYAGFAPTAFTALVIAPEYTSGAGLSAAVGIAGFPNLDVTRSPTLSLTPYMSRAFIEQVFPIGDATVTAVRTPLEILPTLPERRIVFRIGRMSLVDYFDTNSVSTDSHLRFMNWTVGNSGAYDFAANTHGFSDGAILEYIEPRFSVRYGAMLMPVFPESVELDTEIDNAHGQNLEAEVRAHPNGRLGIVRVLAYWNRARMGRYEEAINLFERGLTETPEIRLTRRPGRLKYGFGLNVEQELTDKLQAFLRIGWNEGENESFTYTECNNTLVAGATWNVHAHGQVGIAGVTNGISDPHREYLALGGLGFVLGDGRLRYGREDIVESYYTFRAFRGFYPAVDLQFVNHPGYNTDRGPVVVGTLRLHVEI